MDDFYDMSLLHYMDDMSLLHYMDNMSLLYYMNDTFLLLYIDDMSLLHYMDDLVRMTLVLWINAYGIYRNEVKVCKDYR